MPTIGLFSGKQIKKLAEKKQRLTRTQTAVQARNNILRKYKKILDTRRYYYGGSNNWILYSKAKDAQRTGNVTKDKKKWAKRPHKYDYEGLDTKGGYSSRGPYFGKDLSKGKYSPKINTKRNVLAILKKLYPKTQFIVLGEWGYKNVGVIWTGGPTVKALEKLDMARGLSKKRNWVLGIDIDFRRESKKKFLDSLDVHLGDKYRRSSYKASTTLPLGTVKPAMDKKSKPLQKYKVGKTWDASGYKRKIIGYHGNDSYVVSDNKTGEFRKFGQIIKFKDIDSEIAYDKRAFESHKRSLEQSRLIEKAEAQKKKEYEFTYGFADKLKPLQKDKVLKTLNKTQLYNDKLYKRKDFILEKVKNGYVVKIETWTQTYKKAAGERKTRTKTERVLSKGKSSYAGLTKIELDYAEYLTKKLNLKK